MGQRGRSDRRARLGHGLHRSMDQRGAPAIRASRYAPNYIALHRPHSLISFLSVGPFWAWKVGPPNVCLNLAQRSQAPVPSHDDGGSNHTDDVQRA